MRILVTGGAGFIGANLCRRLLEQGHQVICLDNLFSGREENIRSLRQNPYFSFINQSVIDPIDVKVDQIYNLACPASPVKYRIDPIFTTMTCVQGALNVLEAARKNGATVLQTSTSEIYGEPLIHPQEESYRGNVNTIGPRSCYDEGKRVAESLFFDYHRMYGTEIRVVRIFNTYGPYMSQDDGRVVSNFIVNALKGKNLVLYGDGTQTRSFCYVGDTVEALIRMMNNKDHFAGPVNIGNPKEIQVSELAERVKGFIDTASVISYGTLMQDDPTRRRPDISLAKKKLEWEPRVELSEGLRYTIQYFAETLGEDAKEDLNQ